MAFSDELLALTGTATDAFDVKAMVRRCFLYDFVGSPVRVWDGHGVLNAGGFEWLGTYDSAGQNHHTAPAVRDTRDGASPRYEFGIPYLDLTTFNALKASQALARGRDLICYHVLVKVGEGLVPTTALQYSYRLAIRGVQFSERVEGEPGAEHVIRGASVLARSLEYGRTRVPAGTMTDTAQRARALALGVTADSGCSFVAKNAHRTFIVSGG
jgi:hypothetical protein